MKKQRSWLILVAALVPMLASAGTAFGDPLLYDLAPGAFIDLAPPSIPANTTASSLTGVGGIQGATGAPPPSGGPVENPGALDSDQVTRAGLRLSQRVERRQTGAQERRGVDGFTGSILGGALAQVPPVSQSTPLR